MKINKKMHIRKKGPGAGKPRRNPVKDLTLKELALLFRMMPPKEARKFKAALNEMLSGKHFTRKQERAILIKHGINPKGKVMARAIYAGFKKGRISVQK